MHATLLAAVAALFWDALAAGEISWEDDTKYFYYPLLADVAAALKAGRLPIWEPGMFGGYSLLADGESGMLYPLHLLALRWLEPAAALVVLRCARFYLAGAFTYAFLRATGARRTGALTGALAFTLSGFMVAQVVHENLDSGMVWLPLVLYFAERALRARGTARVRLAAFGGVALAMQALAVHVQVSVFTALVVFPYVGWRALFPERSGPRLLKRLPAGIAIAAVLGVVAAGLSAVQMLPLLDIASRAARGHGIDVAASTINSVSPYQLLTVAFPHLLKRPDNTAVTYWVDWDVTVYVGIPVLFLAAVATLLRRDRFTWFFAAVALLALVLSTGRYGPRWVVLITQDLLGDHGLRSPGRFAFLWSFGAAALAGWGADWLEQRTLARWTRIERWLFAALSMALGGIAAGLILAAGQANHWVTEHPAETAHWLERVYLGFDKSARLSFKADDAYRGIAQALSPANPSTQAWTVSVVGAFALLAAWFLAGGADRRQRVRPTHSRSGLSAGGSRTRPRRLELAALRALTVGVVALPLLAAADRAHPAATFAAIEPEAGSAHYLQSQLAPAGLAADQRPLYRVYTSQPLYLGHTDVEPNVLLPLGIQEAGGYSSLSSTVNLAYGWATETSQGRLLDVWNVRYFLWPTIPESLPSWELTSFHPQRPLVSGSAANAGATAAFRVPPVLAENVRVVATLRDASLIPFGATVAWIAATDDEGQVYRWPLRFGQEIGEATSPPAGAADLSPDQAAAAGVRPLPVFSMREYGAGGKPYGVFFYYAKLALETQRTIVRLSVQPVYVPQAPNAILRVYGLGVGRPDWWVQNVAWSDRERFSLAFDGKDVRVYRNEAALPRAYLLPLAVRLPQGLHLKQMAERGFDPQRMLLVDAPQDAALEGPSEPLSAGTWFSADAAAAADAASGTAAPLVTTPHAAGRVADSPAGETRVLRYAGDRVDVGVDATQAAWLFLADTYDPSWRAYVDGQPRPVRLANAMFRAVAVPAGKHTVTFRYESRPLGLGAAASLATGLGVLALCAGGLAGAGRAARRKAASARPGLR